MTVPFQTHAVSNPDNTSWPTNPQADKPVLIGVDYGIEHKNPQPSNPLDKLSRDELLVLWDNSKKALTAAKEAEMDLRKYVVSRAFPNAEEGTNTLELGASYKLKAVVKYNYNLKDNDTVEKTLDKIARIGNQGSFIADRLVSWTPNFLITEYRNLQKAAESSPEAQEILAAIGEMLIVDEAAPTLTIVEPKK